MLSVFSLHYFNSLHPSEQFFSHVGLGLPGLNQYKAADKVFCSLTQHSNLAGACFLFVCPFLAGCEYLPNIMTKEEVHCLRPTWTGPRSAVGNVSGNRCKSDCRSGGWEFDPGPVPYFPGDWSWNNFYGHSPPFCWIIQEGLFLLVTSESMCTKYWLTACSSLPRKKCG